VSDLTDARDHARAMAARTSDPNAGVRQCRWCHWQDTWVRDQDHKPCLLPEGKCGCRCHPPIYVPTDAERALWARLADEIDDYLTPADDGPGLWEEA